MGPVRSDNFKNKSPRPVSARTVPTSCHTYLYPKVLTQPAADSKRDQHNIAASREAIHREIDEVLVRGVGNEKWPSKLPLEILRYAVTSRQ